MPLELDRVSKRFGEVAAADEVSLTIADREFFALLGPSGCGKTTLLRMVSGIIQPDRGAVRLDGRDITRAPMHARDVTLVFQNYALFPHRTVFDNIAFGLVMRREGKAQIREKVERALQLVRLTGLGERYPAQISGGQQQRVALARALVVAPKVLLLDEPLSNLDARLRDDMRDELKEIQRQVGITTVLVTHDIHEAFALSDRIAVLNRGRVEQIGTPTDIYRLPLSRFVAKFAGKSNEFAGRLETVSAGQGSLVTSRGQRLVGKLGGREIAVGAPVVLMVRPESVTLSAQSSTGGLRAVVRRSTYLGNATRLHLDVAGSGLLVDLPGSGTGAALEAGTEITVGWRPEDAVIFPDGGSQP